MESRETLLAALKDSPDALLLLEEIQQALEEESTQRNAFHALIHENVKAEFINGQIVYHSPVKRKHWRLCTRLGSILDEYVTINKLGEVGVEKVMISLTRNDYEPDICFFSNEKAKDFTDDQMHFPAPDFVVEILSDYTKKNDYGTKFRDYAAHGVAEY